MSIFKILFLILCTFQFLGCVSTRLAEPHTARTLGKGNNEWELSSGVLDVLTNKDPNKDHSEIPFPYFAVGYTRGIFNNFDLGVFIEIPVIHTKGAIGLEGKYQIANSSGYAVSLLFGGGSTPNEWHNQFSYIASVYSFKPYQSYEIALNAKIHQHSSSRSFHIIQSDQTGSFTPVRLGSISPLETALVRYKKYKEVDMSKVSQNIDHILFLIYGSVDISNTLWFTPRWGVTLSTGLAYLFFERALQKNTKKRTRLIGKHPLFGKAGLKLHFNH
ncbi:MAG: hypothetical protein OXK80_05145 [Bdellovibrionales bacterium]|nr:hypothetical protein [Bdellovibrionales bacterium]